MWTVLTCPYIKYIGILDNIELNSQQEYNMEGDIHTIALVFSSVVQWWSFAVYRADPVNTPRPFDIPERDTGVEVKEKLSELVI